MIIPAPSVAGSIKPAAFEAFETFVFFAVKKHCNGICSIVGIEFPEVNTLGMGVPDPADFKLQGFGPSEGRVGDLGRLRPIQGPGEPGEVCHGVF